MDAAIFPTMLSLSQLPVSPPPDHKLFFNNNNTTTTTTKNCPASHTAPASVLANNPLLIKTFVREMEGPAVKKAPSLLEKHYSTRRTTQDAQQCQQQIPRSQQPFTLPKQPDTPTSSVTPSSVSAASSAETKVTSPSIVDDHKPQPTTTPQQQPQVSQQQPQPQPQPQQQNQQHFSPPENPFLHLAADPALATAGLGAGGVVPPVNDPKYVQMVSRMAAYYQQRCQAILNFQQQRCQTWATSHRQKCQEMMQAAMLVVAWYIRDRIGRRRRRNKRAFRRGLREKNTAAVMRRTPKGETVRKWVMNIPDEQNGAASVEKIMMSPTFSHISKDERVLDAEERAFDVDKEVSPDKDSQLFTVADQMIKSQLAKIDVPLLGALNLDDSDSETEDGDEDMVDKYYYGQDDYEMEEGDNDEEYEDDDDDDDLEYEEDDSYVEDEASKEAMHGTGKGSLKRKRSESTSGVE